MKKEPQRGGSDDLTCAPVRGQVDEDQKLTVRFSSVGAGGAHAEQFGGRSRLTSG